MPTEPKANTVPDDRVFRQLVESASIAFLIYDKKILYANPAAEKLTGFSLRELLRKTPGELIGNELTTDDPWAATPRRPVFKLLCRDHVRQVEVGTSAIEYDGVEAVQATLHEVNQALASRVLRTLFKAVETTQIGITVTDPDGSILYTNQAEAEMHGYTVDELIGSDVRVLAPPELSRPMSRDQLTSLHRLRRETRNQHRDGHTFPVQLLSDVVTDDSGKPIAMVTISEDVTKSRKVERMLRMLAKAFETTQFGVTVTDPGGKILYTNQAEADMHGYAVDELIGSDVRMLAPPALASPLSKEELLRLRSRRRESVNLHRDGGIFPVHLASDMVADDDGEPMAVVTICQDLTDRRRADDERAALEGQLRQAQKMEAVGQLAGGVAHDFNNLLVVIKGHAALALKKVERESRLSYHLTQVDQAADKAAAVTRQLLAFGRRQALDPTDLCLNKVASKLHTILRRSIGENIELRLETCPADTMVRIDPGQIEQVIINLCLNARDAIQDQGHLTVRTDSIDLDSRFCEQQSWAREGSWERLTVSDDGCGMDGETLSHVFEPFFTTKEAGKGTGLGLATVYGVVEQHDGFLHIESELGAGTTVEVYLPRIGLGGQPKAPETLVAEAPVARGHHEAVLVAEDDPRVRQVVVNVLEKAGYTVLKARDGAEAVKVFTANARRVSMVLMDLVMPVMGGRTAREHILGIRPGTRFLLTTGYATGADDLSAIKDVPLILKPYSYQTMLKKGREVLAS